MIGLVLLVWGEETARVCHAFPVLERTVAPSRSFTRRIVDDSVLSAKGGEDHRSQSVSAYPCAEGHGLPAQPQTETSQGWAI